MATTTRQAITDTSPSSATTAAGASTLTGLDDLSKLLAVATLQGATGGTLDVYLQGFDGTDWFDVVHFPQLSAGAASVTYAVPLNRLESADAPLVIGLNTAPALAVNTVSPGEFSDRLRMLFVAGASTTAGAAQTVVVVGTEDVAEDLLEQDLTQMGARV